MVERVYQGPLRVLTGGLQKGLCFSLFENSGFRVYAALGLLGCGFSSSLPAEGKLFGVSSAGVEVPLRSYLH